MLFWVSVVENAQADQKDIANELSLLIEMSVNDHFKCLGADSIPYVFEEDESFVSYFLPVLWRIVSGCDKNGPWHVIEKHFVNWYQESRKLNIHSRRENVAQLDWNLIRSVYIQEQNILREFS